MGSSKMTGTIFKEGSILEKVYIYQQNGLTAQEIAEKEGWDLHKAQRKLWRVNQKLDLAKAKTNGVKKPDIKPQVKQVQKTPKPQEKVVIATPENIPENIPEIMETILRCLLSFLRTLEKKLINMLASINGRPSPAEKTPSSSMPSSRVSSLLARSSMPERIIPTQGIHPNENIIPKIKELR